jgi:hypothetical protein
MSAAEPQSKQLAQRRAPQQLAACPLSLIQEFADYRAQTDAALAALVDRVKRLEEQRTPQNGSSDIEVAPDEWREEGRWGLAKEAAAEFNYSESGIRGMIRRSAVRTFFQGGRRKVFFADVAREVQKKRKNVVRFFSSSPSCPP